MLPASVASVHGYHMVQQNTPVHKTSTNVSLIILHVLRTSAHRPTDTLYVTISTRAWWTAQ